MLGDEKQRLKSSFKNTRQQSSPPPTSHFVENYAFHNCKNSSLLILIWSRIDIIISFLVPKVTFRNHVFSLSRSCILINKLSNECVTNPPTIFGQNVFSSAELVGRFGQAVGWPVQPNWIKNFFRAIIVFFIIEVSFKVYYVINIQSFRRLL